MPKSRQKTAGADQPANQRGKSRFGPQGRPARVVLPERPPRAVDHEIVSILLGSDPAALTTQADGVKGEAPARPDDVSPALIPAGTQGTPVAGSSVAPPVGVPEATAGRTEGIPVEHATGDSTELTAGTRAPVEAPVASPAPTQQVAVPPSQRARRAPAPPTVRRTSETVAPVFPQLFTREGTISSFGEFAERWKHGLRKGQLKVCEVLYQKTYAVGRTECVTSFSELERLTGLKIRQCFNIIAQLEALRFVERSRSESTSNKKDQGSVIRFHLYPVQ